MTRKLLLAGTLLAGGVAAWAASVGGIATHGAAPPAPGVVKLIGGTSLTPAPVSGAAGATASPATAYDFSAVQAAIDASKVKNVAIVVGNVHWHALQVLWGQLQS